MLPKALSVLALGLLLGATQTHATQTIRELWDNGIKGNLNSQGANLTSGVGFAPASTWAVSPAGNTSLRIDTWDWWWDGIDENGMLPPQGTGGNGSVAFYGSDGNMASLTNPATGNPYGYYCSQCYATRALAPSAYINFSANGTYYFSYRQLKSHNDWGWPGDNAGGIGFASSSATNASFVGFGTTRGHIGDSVFLAPDGITDISETVYIATGTLNQAGTGHNVDTNALADTDGGPYYPRTYGPAYLTPESGGMIVLGRLTTTSSGAATLDVAVITSYGAVPSDPSAVTWNATYSFTETNLMTQLLVWQHGSGPALQDAVRVGTAWSDVVGLEMEAGIQAVPGSEVYSGTTVTLSQSAALNTGTYPMTFQWYSNSVAITDATTSSLVLSNATPDFTADYSVVVSNSFGLLTNVLHVTVDAHVLPFFTTGLSSPTSYAGGASASFKIAVNGSGPFDLQLYQGASAVAGATTHLDVPGTTNVTLAGPITLAEAGGYTVIATSAYGTSTNSSVGTLTVLTPAAGSFAAAVTALSPWGYWRMDDTPTANDPAIYDNWGNNQGSVVVSDLSNMRFGQAGAPFVGFPTPHKAIYIGIETNGTPYRLSLPVLPYYTNTMTFVMWVSNVFGGATLKACNGYVDSYGLESSSSNTLVFDWGGGVAWDSGLTVPAQTWSFVALVVESTQATFYVGTNKFFLDSATNSALSLSDSTTIGDTGLLTPLAVGRNPNPSTEGGNQHGMFPGTWSDIAVFYQSLTPQQIENLYTAGIGQWIDGKRDGAGNLVLNWLPGLTLQEASSLTGSWTDVAGSPTPPLSVPLNPSLAQHFYRVRR